MSADVQEAVVFFACVFAAIVLHEISHGVVALWFGDDTAKRAGRLTLNPLRHVDPFGTILLPAILTLTGFGAFGYAKPVPVNPTRLRNPRRDMLLVSLAGPTTNFCLMGVAAIATRFALSDYTGFYSRPSELPLGIEILFFFAYANLLLGLFNLLPIPPLDGASLIERALPASALPTWHRIRPYGFVVLLLLVLSTNLLGRFLSPFVDALLEFIQPS